MAELDDFLKDIKEYNIFSYDEYRNASLDLRLKKIQLLNEYNKLKYGELPKLPVFIDCDGVTLDTMNLAKRLLLINHNIDFDKRDRKDLEQQNIIANFFKTLDWRRLLQTTDEINRSLEFLKLIKESSIYLPTIYTAINSEIERIEKESHFSSILPTINIKFVFVQTPKQCDDNNSVIIDDDNFNLVSWNGYPLHFDSTIPTIFPNIDDLGELYYLFYRDPTNLEKFIHKDALYNGLVKEEDVKTKKITWKKKN